MSLSLMVATVLFVVLMGLACIIERKGPSMVLMSFAIAAFLFMIIWLVFFISEFFYNSEFVKPYCLSYADTLSIVTQIIAFLGSTCIGVVGLYFTFIDNRKKFKNYIKSKCKNLESKKKQKKP